MPIADLFKPYLWLAAAGFAVGFLGYVAVTPATPASSAVTVDLSPSAAWSSTSAGAAPASDGWNLPKEI